MKAVASSTITNKSGPVGVSSGNNGTAAPNVEVTGSNRLQSRLALRPLTREGPLRLLEAGRLALERLGDPDEAMNLAESALALMFGCVGAWIRGDG